MHADDTVGMLPFCQLYAALAALSRNTCTGMVCREYNMSRVAAEHVSLKGLSVLRNTVLDVQDEQMQEPPQRNKAKTCSITSHIKRENADLWESSLCCVRTRTC